MDALLLIILIGGITAPVVGFGCVWYFELLKWSPFWNNRFNRPYYRGHIFKGRNFVGYFVRTVKQVAGNPIIFDSEKWGSFARPSSTEQEFHYGALETRLIYRLDVVEAGRSLDGIHAPEGLVFGDDPKTIRKMLHSEQIKDLTTRPKDTDWTKVLMIFGAIVGLIVVVYLITGPR